MPIIVSESRPCPFCIHTPCYTACVGNAAEIHRRQRNYQATKAGIIMEGEPQRVDLRVGPTDPAVIQNVEAIIKGMANARKDQGMTQTELAKLAGTDQRAISLIENRKHDPKAGTALRIAAALGRRLVLEDAGTGEPLAEHRLPPIDENAVYPKRTLDIGSQQQI